MKRIALLFTLLFLFTAPATASAAPLNDVLVRAGETVDRDITVPGGNLTIEAGAIVNGNVTVFGGNAVIAGEVMGDLAVFGGNVTLSGTTQGDVALFGGNLTLAETAVISGDCVTMGGAVEGDDREGVVCASFSGFPSLGAIFSGSPSAPPPAPNFAARMGQFFGQVTELAGQALLLSIAALILAAAAPDQLNRISRTVKERPAASGAVGVLTGVAVPSLLILLLLISALLIIVCIGLLGFPLALFVFIALIAAVVMGWVAIGALVGQKALCLLKMEAPSLLATAVVGTALLTLGVGFIQFLPLGGFFSGLLLWGLASIGLGAAALTQFGRHDYPAVDRPRRKMNETLGGDEVEDIPVHKL
jgi:cytoskeletal protein CcmA (bactofilin family)